VQAQDTVSRLLEEWHYQRAGRVALVEAPRAAFAALPSNATARANGRGVVASWRDGGLAAAQLVHPLSEWAAIAHQQQQSRRRSTGDHQEGEEQTEKAWPLVFLPAGRDCGSFIPYRRPRVDRAGLDFYFSKAERVRLEEQARSHLLLGRAVPLVCISIRVCRVRVSSASVCVLQSWSLVVAVMACTCP
jgi:hypothetical protein